VDANPYLAIAASLACGWLGMVEGRTPDAPVTGSAHVLPRLALPRDQSVALERLNASERLREVLGTRFLAVVNAVKQAEFDAYQRVISSWERENLLLNV
jgi:glutamine synthetase